MNFIKKVFDKKIDEEVHLQFQKFSRGEFPNRAIVKVKKVKDKITISTTAEFANELVRLIAEKLGSNKTKVTGAIISTLDLGKQIDFNTRKQFMGIKQYGIERDMSGKEILEMLEKFPKVFFALSFSSGEEVLKIKAKAPKSAKPKNKDEAPAPDFCKLITTDEKIAKDFVWETNDFKLAEIYHDFIIESIVIPNSLKEEKDFAVVREKSLRKGKILRRAIIDGKETKEEIQLEA
ncbi:MAG: hypothetical protein AABX99_00115 [Nanoarchaeota archaeon]